MDDLQDRGIEGKPFPANYEAAFVAYVMNAPREFGTIYYIACMETNRVKIGYTKSRPENRLDSFRTGCPTPIQLMCAHPGTKKDEAHFHELFAHLRLRGEWFEMGEELLRHMMLVCWVMGARAVNEKSHVPEWLKVGLLTIEENLGSLLPQVERLIR